MSLPEIEVDYGGNQLPLWWLDTFSYKEYSMENCITAMENMPENVIDLVFTDPPYGKATIGLYAEIAPLINKVLKPGGYAFVYASDYWFPECFAPFQENMKFFYLFHLLLTEATAARVFPKKVQCGAKTLMAFTKGQASDHDWAFNTIRSRREYGKHPWQQAVGQAKYVLEKFSNEGDTVLDPFLGSGTTLVACKELNRIGLGFENDPDCEVIINERLGLAKTAQSTL
jgi:DNA modification methylase